MRHVVWQHADTAVEATHRDVVVVAHGRKDAEVDTSYPLAVVRNGGDIVDARVVCATEFQANGSGIAALPVLIVMLRKAL